MSTTLESLEAELLRLSPADRSYLLDRIVVSLDTNRALDDAWDREAARRDAEIENGTSAPVSGKDVVARLRAEAG